MTGRHGRSPRTGWNQRSPPKYLSLPPPQLPFGPPLLKSNPYSILDEQFSSPAKVHAQSAMHFGEQEQFSQIVNDKKPTAKTSNSNNINDSMSKQKSVTCNTHNYTTKYKKIKRTKSFRDRYKEKLDRYMSLNTINDNSPTESRIKKPPSPIRINHNLFPAQIVQHQKPSISMPSNIQTNSRRASRRIQDLPSHRQKLFIGFEPKDPLRKLFDHTYTDKEIQGILTSQLRRFMLVWNKGQPDDTKVMQTVIRDYLKPELLQECYKVRDAITLAVKKTQSSEGLHKQSLT